MKIIDNELLLLQSLNSKICHDLANSISAIDTCLELSNNSNPSISTPAKELVLTESKHLVEKIKFFRTTYGLLDHDSGIPCNEINKHLGDFLASRAFQFQFECEDTLTLPAHLAQAVLCISAIIADTIPSTGSLNIITYRKQIKIVGIGKWPSSKLGNLEILNGDANPNISSTNCREYYALKLCTLHSYRLSAKVSIDGIEYIMNKYES